PGTPQARRRHRCPRRHDSDQRDHARHHRHDDSDRAIVAAMSRKEDALEYHRRGRKGKLEVVPTKPLVSQIDLSLAYTPGVAEPCLEIAKDEDQSWEYTARANLVAVISNGTAVLGLGDIGPSAGKPVMEGKACLFKKFA